MAMIECVNVSVSHGTHKVIKNFNAGFDEGTISVVTGGNGAGKSTLLSTLAGDIFDFDGEITIGGRSLRQITFKELANLRSVALQHHSYWMTYSVSDILRLGNELVAETRWEEIISVFAMEKFLHQSITTLSGGQLQRVEIARAFMRELPIVFLDEPFAAQDFHSISRIREFIQSEADKGCTIVMAAHMRDKDLDWCDQVLALPDRSVHF
jgi:ABC-type cobalamin/Fe3+-siderophores transport system ATPase subunit